jgi:serine/threonine-protein kinase
MLRASVRVHHGDDGARVLLRKDAVQVAAESDQEPTAPSAIEGEDASAQPGGGLDNDGLTPTMLSRQTPLSGSRIKESASIVRAELVAGQVLGGRYRLERRVGAGGMGEVWSATHSRVHTHVAVKVLLRHAVLMPDVVARFEREADLLGRAQGPHVPRVIDFFVDDECGPVLVSELVEGLSMADLLKTAISVEAAVDLGIDLATGLEELHRAHVVHRDLKPGNIVMRPVLGGCTPVIVDLGVSRLVQDGGEPPDLPPITAADIVVGTAEYMAPEQVLSCKEVTPAVDVYALGALLFKAVTGAHVFGTGLSRAAVLRAKLMRDAPPVKTGRSDALAEGFARVIARALEREPSRRHRSAGELGAELARLRTESTRVRGSNPPRTEPASTRHAAAPASNARKDLALVKRSLVALALAMLVPAVDVCSRPPDSERSRTPARPRLTGVQPTAATQRTRAEAGEGMSLASTVCRAVDVPVCTTE